MSEYNVSEAFQKAKSFEVAGIKKLENGSGVLLLGSDMTIRTVGGGKEQQVFVTVGGVERECKGGIFVNKLDDVINFLGNIEGAEDSIKRYETRKSYGISSILKAKLEG